MIFTPTKPPKKLFDSSVPKKISKRKFQSPLTPYRPTTRSHYHQNNVIDYGDDPQTTQTILNYIKSVNIRSLPQIGKGSFSSVYLIPQYNLSLKVCPVYNKLYSRKTLIRSIQRHLNLFKNSQKAPKFGSIQKQFLLKTHFVLENNGFVYIGSNFCEGGNLDQFVLSSIKQNTTIQTSKIYEILTDILLGIELLHSNGLIHMDIKPENILITKGFHILCDFGCMVKLNDKYKIEGDSRFLAPEIFQESKLAKTEFDMYSIGATIYQLAAGDLDLPTEGEYYNTLRNINTDTNLIYRCERTEDLKQLIKSMMLADTNSRAKLSDLFQNEMIKELVTKRIELAKTILKGNSTLKYIDKKFSNKDEKLNPNLINKNKLSNLLNNFSISRFRTFQTPLSPMVQNTRKKKKISFNSSKNLLKTFKLLEQKGNETILKKEIKLKNKFQQDQEKKQQQKKKRKKKEKQKQKEKIKFKEMDQEKMDQNTKKKKKKKKKSPQIKKQLKFNQQNDLFDNTRKRLFNLDDSDPFESFKYFDKNEKKKKKKLNPKKEKKKKSKLNHNKHKKTKKSKSIKKILFQNEAGSQFSQQMKSNKQFHQSIKNNNQELNLPFQKLGSKEKRNISKFSKSRQFKLKKRNLNTPFQINSPLKNSKLKLENSPKFKIPQKK
ncbi:membrane-associated tyrosine- and threonine-specific cdc2-inhibitory kinase [Anaeramoeba flamelloides]|uniref:Membrane-associated tyrosine- and threonine-specific cdc2-inhibitory kinase n=1 Tax=Anaeramoeba flamelloides TaxID=1746091 RepID=A0ABQ8ZEH9_9EUKA|nr:membrane-associated tyrosine- and threonine-specific cdc2-inhibitory kinase [Anaeramoeba flamelloides]